MSIINFFVDLIINGVLSFIALVFAGMLISWFKNLGT